MGYYYFVERVRGWGDGGLERLFFSLVSQTIDTLIFLIY
jgi:hypothetical protein